MKNPLVATGVPDSIEKVQLALDCAFAAGRASVALRPVENELDNLKSLVVMEFNEDEVPIFTQGYHPHELTEVVTADRCTAFVKIIVDLKAQLAVAQQAQPERAPLSESEISKLVMPYGFSSIQGFDHIKAYTRRVEAYIKQGGQHD